MFPSHDHDIDIAVAEVQLEEAQKELDTNALKCEQTRVDLLSAQQEELDLTEQIDSIPAERLNIKKLLEKRTALTNGLSSTRDNISELKDEITEFDDKLKVYDDFLTTIDIEDLLSQKKEYDEFKQLYDDTVNRARLMDNDYKAMSKKLTLLN